MGFDPKMTHCEEHCGLSQDQGFYGPDLLPLHLLASTVQNRVGRKAKINALREAIPLCVSSLFIAKYL